MDGYAHANRAYASLGRWIGRTWALLVVWALTYIILFVAAFRLQEQWLLLAIPIPILVHMVLEPLLIKHEARTFGEVEE